MRLLIKTSGTKCWRYNYRFSGKQKTLALGVYPSRALKEARLLRQDAEKLIRNKIDPAEARQQQLRENQLKSANRFSLVAEQWWYHQKGIWSEDHALCVWTRLQVNVFPVLGDRPIHEIQPLDVIHVVKQIEKRNALDVAQRVNRDVGRVFSYAVQHGLMSLSPSSELRGASSKPGNSVIVLRYREKSCLDFCVSSINMTRRAASSQNLRCSYFF